jgi:hypothetical protein
MVSSTCLPLTHLQALAAVNVIIQVIGNHTISGDLLGGWPESGLALRIYRCVTAHW